MLKVVAVGELSGMLWLQGAMMILADLHVHLHPTFDWADSLAFAARNLRAVAEQSSEADYQGVVCLADIGANRAFATMRSQSDKQGEKSGPFRNWTFHSTGEAASVKASSTASGELVIIAGSQIITREGLEVLAVGTTDNVPDGRPIEEVIDRTRASGAIAVIPYGFGKFVGRRGKVIQGVIDRHLYSVFFADNGNRLGLMRLPRAFRLVRASRRPILAGSDPLPLSGEECRIGSHGLILQGRLSKETPASDLVDMLRGASEQSVMPFGRGERFGRFTRNQLKMIVRKALGNAAR